MNRFIYPARAILLGLLTTQILATLHVYLSNADLYRTVAAISQAGYLAIPNEHVVHSLKEFRPAFFGGLFFTLSIGTGLSVLSLACAWLWDRIFGRNNALLIPMILLSLGAVAAVNSQGFCPIPASFFLLTPLVVFLSALKWMPKEGEKRIWSNRFIHFLPVVILAAVWATHADKFSFLNVRDFLLLSNPVGKSINDFYYRYTLYPAQTFKPLRQKTLKTCHLGPVKDKASRKRMEKVLINYDYLPVAADAPIDLEIEQAEDELAFKQKGKTVLQTTFKEFFSKPQKVLGDFSAQTDRHVFLRQATIVSLLIGFPITLYVMVFALFTFVLRFFLGPTPASAVAATLCLSIGLALLVPIRLARQPIEEQTDLSKVLASERWQQRVTGLRTVVKQEREIGNLHPYRNLLASPHVAERYWLAKALGVSRNPETYLHLLAFLDDPHLNVSSMAFLSLGVRQDRRAVNEILRRIDTSTDWYNQWYAYRALRRLGWSQSSGEWKTPL